MGVGVLPCRAPQTFGALRIAAGLSTDSSSVDANSSAFNIAKVFEQQQQQKKQTQKQLLRQHILGASGCLI